MANRAHHRDIRPNLRRRDRLIRGLTAGTIRQVSGRDRCPGSWEFLDPRSQIGVERADDGDFSRRRHYGCEDFFDVREVWIAFHSSFIGLVRLGECLRMSVELTRHDLQGLPRKMGVVSYVGPV